MKKLYRIKITLDYVAYHDTEIEDNENFQKDKIANDLKELASDYPYGSTNTLSIRPVASEKGLPDGWDGSSYPYGVTRTQKDIKTILKEGRKKR